MTAQDREFIDFIIDERINILYKDWISKFQDSEKDNQIEQDYETTLSGMPKEKRDILEDYYGKSILRSEHQSIFFYRKGVLDGFKLCKYIHSALDSEC